MHHLAATNYEEDDDFLFVRKSKKAKTDEPEPPKKSGRGKASKERVPKNVNTIPEEVEEEPEQQLQPATTKPTTRKSSRRKPSVEPTAKEDAQPEPAITATTTIKTTRKPARLPVDEDEVLGEASTNGASRSRGGKKGGASRTAKVPVASPPHEASVESAKITLPMSDTPIINRNKEMRKKGTGNRRSSLGSRGRRASSLIESGQTAIPHREVNPAEFYKHIEAEGLTEPRRMKQLLTWCGERALSDKPPHGSKNASIVLGGQFLRDLIPLTKENGDSLVLTYHSSRDSGPIT